MVDPSRTLMLTELYSAFNARDIDAVLVHLTEDVDWPNAWEGGRVVGHDAVRRYWTRQWAEINPLVEPRGFAPDPDDAVAVTVAQRVLDLDDNEIGAGTVLHIFSFDGDLISRMDVREPLPEAH